MLSKKNPAEAAEPPISMKDACDAYLKDAEVRKLRPETLRKNSQCINRISAAVGSRTVRSITVSDLRDLRAGWKFSAITMRKNIEIMRAFLAFCVESGWVSGNPAKAVKPPIVPPNPTLPFIDEEFEKILWALDCFREKHRKCRSKSAGSSRHSSSSCATPASACRTLWASGATASKRGSSFCTKRRPASPFGFRCRRSRRTR